MENNQENQSIVEEIPSDEAWKSLDFVVRKWAALSGFEKDQENYQNLRRLYQD
jgi:hypothetical protein